jgi:hypothetical protein
MRSSSAFSALSGAGSGIFVVALVRIVAGWGGAGRTRLRALAAAIRRSIKGAVRAGMSTERGDGEGEKIRPGGR